MQANNSQKEFHVRVYDGYKISIPIKIRKLLHILPHDEIILSIDNENRVRLNSVHNELLSIQKEMKQFFKKKSIVGDFLKHKNGDYDD